MLGPRIGPNIGIAGPGAIRIVCELDKAVAPRLEIREEDSDEPQTSRPGEAGWDGAPVLAEHIGHTAGSVSGGHRVHRFTVSALNPEARYRYRLWDDASNGEIAETRGRVRPVPSEVRGRQTFLLVSCNRADAYSRALLYESVWKDVADQIDTDPSIRFIVHCGDQVYCDSAWDRISDEYRSRFRGWTLTAQQWARTNHEAWKEEYRRFYQDAWKPIAARRVLRSVPSVMMWDDHDIHDGYGSRDTDVYPWLREIYAVAREVFEEYQTSLNPNANLGADNYGFATLLLGSHLVVLDTRSQRQARTLAVLGTPQLNALERVIGDVRDNSPLFVVSSTPFFSLIDLGDAEYVVRQFGALFVDAQDDYLDGWNTPAHSAELARILKLIGRRSDDRAAPVVVLSGDIHIQHLLEFRMARRDRPLYQVVSSPLTNAPQGSLGVKLFPRNPQAAVQLMPDVKGKLLGVSNHRGYVKVMLEETDAVPTVRVQYRLETELGGALRPWPGSPVVFA